MNKIASPQDLATELQRILAYAGQSQPSRARIASALNELADRVAAKTPAKLKGKKLDSAIEKAYYQHGSGVQIDMMSIGKIFREGQKAYEGAATVEEADKALDEAMKAAVIKYRRN